MQRSKFLGPEVRIQVGTTVKIERADRRRESLELLDHLLGGRPVLDEKRLRLRVSRCERQVRNDLGLFRAGLDGSERIENRSLLLVRIGESFQVASDNHAPRQEMREGGRETALSVVARPISLRTSSFSSEGGDAASRGARELRSRRVR